MARRGKLIGDVKHVLAHERAASLVPATFLAVGILDLIPVPTDVGYFYVQRWLNANSDRLSATKRWAIQSANYYLWDTAWYLSLFALTYFGGKSVRQKALIGIGAVTTGLLATLVWKWTHPGTSIARDQVQRLVDESEEQGNALESAYGVPAP